MFKVQGLVLTVLGLFAIVPLSACPAKGNGNPDSAEVAGDGGPAGADGTGLAPLAAPCQQAAGCASGFCADGVCCDSACDQTCFSCSSGTAAGHCAPVAQGQDLAARAPCAAPMMPSARGARWTRAR